MDLPTSEETSRTQEKRRTALKDFMAARVEKVHASIGADTVLIAGEVTGDITARRKISLDRTARVIGDFATPGIATRSGPDSLDRIRVTGPALPSQKEAEKTSSPA